MLARLNVLAALMAMCASGPGCRSVECGEGCGHGCSLAFQPFDCSREGCCGGGCCGAAPCGPHAGCTTPCGPGGCSGNACGQGAGLKGWLSRNVCGCTGCGELYWSEWYNDPPAVYEPCDDYGNHACSQGCGCEGYRAPYRLASGVARGKGSVPGDPRECLELADGEDANGEFLR